MKKKTISDKATDTLAVFIAAFIVAAVLSGAFLGGACLLWGPAVSSSDCPPCSCKCNEEDRP